jgi:hypothetical protein
MAQLRLSKRRVAVAQRSGSTSRYNAASCAPARYSDADRRRKSLYLKAASYEFLVKIRRRLTCCTMIIAQHLPNRLPAGNSKKRV